MKYIALLAIAFTLTACDDQTTERIIRGGAAAVDGYYGRGYYGQPPVQNTTVVTPAPVVAY